MNIWHDVSPEKITPERFLAVIEIKKGCKNKYELDKETGLLRLDRVLYTSTHYPANYGFIPRTYAQDDDPLDVLVLCSEAIEPLTLVACRPIGMIEMVDGEERDEKIIAVPLGDPNYNYMFDISQLPDHVLDEMRSRLARYQVTNVDIGDISKEVGTLIDNVESMSLTKGMIWDVSGKALDTVLICVVTPKDHMRPIEENTLRRWLSVRTKVKNVKLFVDPKANE